MLHLSKPSVALAALSLSTACLFGVHAPSAQAATGESVLYSFTGGNDGGQPRSGLAEGSDGTFYGATTEGGSDIQGVLYSIDLDGNYTVLHTFGDGSTPNDGNKGFAAPIVGSDGTIYGVCQRGGVDDFGVIYKMTPAGKYSLLYTFKGGSDGGRPGNSLVFGKDGKLYGATDGDPATNSTDNGSIFSIKTDGTGYIVEYRFNSTKNVSKVGGHPASSLVNAPGSSKVMYGVTFGGGAGGNGTFYAFTPDTSSSGGSLKVLHAFADGSVANDGTEPYMDTLLVDSAGNIYGDTEAGGADSHGTVYRMTPSGVETILHSFDPANFSSEGSQPTGGVILAADGNLYGTTSGGGESGTLGGGANGCIYSIAPDGSNYNPAVYQFKGAAVIDTDGQSPNGPLLEDSDGNLVGTTILGGNSSNGTTYGTLFEYEFATASGLKSVVLSPTSTEGGSAATTANRVYWNGNAPANEKVTLTSSNTAVATVPATVTIDSGSSSHLFTITTKKVTSTQTVTITATSGGISKTATLTVTP